LAFFLCNLAYSLRESTVDDSNLCNPLEFLIPLSDNLESLDSISSAFLALGFFLTGLNGEGQSYLASFSSTSSSLFLALGFFLTGLKGEGQSYLASFSSTLSASLALGFFLTGLKGEGQSYLASFSST